MKDLERRVEQLAKTYGDGTNGACPSRDQWRELIDNTPDGGITLINFFKMRSEAIYPNPTDAPIPPGTGDEAFQRYAAVSGGVLEKVGGQFMLVAPFKGTIIGQDEEWDLIAIGTYPNVSSVLGLFEDAAYQQAFVHREAACARQKVFFC